MTLENTPLSDPLELQAQILELEKSGLVTRTFRRLDPDRQEAVVNAIMEEAAEKGPAAISIKQVAERAEASVGSLYQYFGSRSGLMQFAVRFVVRSVVALFKLGQPYLARMPLREALRSYLTVGVEWGKLQGGLVRFIARAAYQGDPDLSQSVVQPIAAVMRQTTSDILAQAAARGEVRPDVDLEATARVVNVLLIALGDAQLLPYLNTYYQAVDRDITPARLLDAALDLIMQGVAPVKGKKKP
jgi:TetR/AcrR family transcriptional regulator